jgi:tyrosyl-tRNA synthetase
LAHLKDDLEKGAKHPRQVKENLAVEIVTRYHGRNAAGEAAQEFAHIFREKGLPEEIEEVTLQVDGAKLWLPKMLTEAGLAAGTSEARRLITQGGVQVEGEKVTDASLELAVGKSYLLKVGKRRFKRVTLAE